MPDSFNRVQLPSALIRRVRSQAIGHVVDTLLGKEAALIEDEIDLVQGIPGVDFHRFRPDRNAAAGGALPKVAGTTR